MAAEFKCAKTFKDPARDLEDALQNGYPLNMTTDEDVETMKRVAMRDRQISVRRVADELGIPKVHEIVSNRLSMSKTCTRWVPKLLTRRAETCRSRIATRSTASTFSSLIVVESIVVGIYLLSYVLDP